MPRCLEQPTISSKPTHLFMVGKLDQGPEYEPVAGGELLVVLFRVASLLPSACCEARGAARATRGIQATKARMVWMNSIVMVDEW